MQQRDAVQVALDKTLKEAGYHSQSLPRDLILPFLLNLCFCCRAAAAHTQLDVSHVTPPRDRRPSFGKSEKSPSVAEHSGSPGSALLKEIKRGKLLPVSYAFESLQALSTAAYEIKQLEENGGFGLESLWNEAAGGAHILHLVELHKWVCKRFPALNMPRPLTAAFKWTTLSDKDKPALTPQNFLLFLKTLCLCCRVCVAFGPLASERIQDETDTKRTKYGVLQRSIDFEAFCFYYLSSFEFSSSAGDRSAVQAAPVDTTPTRSSLRNLAATEAMGDGEWHTRQLSQRFREFELEFGLEELIVMACNSSACSAVTTALTRHVKLCVEQGAVASVCHSAWTRLQDFKTVMHLLRQSIVEGEATALETALRPLLQKVYICFFSVFSSTHKF
jgi:hypothetical protein